MNQKMDEAREKEKEREREKELNNSPSSETGAAK
jgi:hypothetical protein